MAPKKVQFLHLYNSFAENWCKLVTIYKNAGTQILKCLVGKGIIKSFFYHNS